MEGRTQSICAVAGAILVLCAGCAPMRTSDPERTYEPSSRYSRPPKVLLEEPVTIQEVDAYLDGGTTVVALVGADGESFTFCKDGRMVTDEPTPGGFVKPDNTQGRIFVHARHPSGPNALLVPSGGEYERDIAVTLRSALVTEFGDATIQAVESHCRALPNAGWNSDEGWAQEPDDCEVEGRMLMGVFSVLWRRTGLDRQAPD